jgi:hypothetical protein
MADQGQLKLIGVPQFATDFEVVDVSEEIREEILAINSIYGDGTWEVETTYIENGKPKIRTRLRPPAREQDPSSPGDRVSLNVVLPSTYPQERPEFKGVGKWKSLSPGHRNVCILVVEAVYRLYEAGSVCMYQALEFVADRSSLLDEDGRLDAVKARDVAPGLVEELQWTHWDDVDVSNITAVAECTVCMDEGLAFQMAPLPCGCHYCLTCFTGKSTYLLSTQVGTPGPRCSLPASIPQGFKFG